MVLRKNIFTAFILCLSFCPPFYAQTGGAGYFSHIDIDKGLSHNTVLSIAGDSRGFLWFATQDGLNRYDGYEITVFRHADSDSTSIADNSINKLFTDSCGRLWIGTGTGLSLWNGTKEKFENFSVGATVMVTAIGEVSPSRLLVGTRNGLYVFDVEEKAFVEGLSEATQGLIVNVIANDGDKVWLGTEAQGLFCYSITDGEVQKLSALSSDLSIQSVLPDESGLLWVGTEGDGLFRIDLNTQTTRNFRHHSGGLCSDYVRALSKDANGNLWIGTLSGLSIYDSSTKSFTTYSSDVLQEGSLSHKSVKCIYRDGQGGMWLGTFFGGVNYHHNFHGRFSNLRRGFDATSLNDNVVSCLVEDGDGEIWVGTNNGGVNRYDPLSGRFSHYFLYRGVDDVEYNDVKSVFVRGNDIYVGTHGGGMSLLQKTTGKITRCGSGKSPVEVYSIIARDSNSLWIGTLQGLYSYNCLTGSFAYESAVLGSFHSSPLRVRSLFSDSSGRLWVGAEDGVGVYVVADGVLVRQDVDFPETLAHSFISDFHEDSFGNVWIGSHRGLWRCSTDGRFKQFSIADGLSNDSVQGIEEDCLGRLWISTNSGLCCFNPYSDIFRNYTVNDGLQSNEFNIYSHLRSSSGVMYFGGVNGITVFSPEDIVDNPYAPVPIITELRVFDRVVVPDDMTGILSESINEVSRIRIKPSQNSFSIAFSVCNYVAGERNTFAYMLEGLDSGWLAAPASRAVTYAFLPAGKYRFLVKAANNDGKWCGTPAVLEIEILPVWYRTVWAGILFVLLLLLVVSVAVVFYLYRKSMETRLKMEQKDRENMEEIHQMKMRFFINISHELRTPLTMIIAPLQEILSRSSDIKTNRQLRNMLLNARRLLHLVDQQMDYRRSELGVFRLSVRSENVHGIILENCRYYEETAKSKKLKFTISSEVEGQSLLVDAQYLELILNNLLSNAFKYTEEGGVSVRVFINGSGLVVEVSDTGMGISEADKDRIFERFYQIDNKYPGSGIGLSLAHNLVELHHGRIEVESEEGRGSCFRVFLPQDISVYSEEELSASGSDHNSFDSGEDRFIDEPAFVADRETVPESIEGNPVVLVVEDNEEMRRFIYDGLRERFNVLTASNGQQALEIVRSSSPDVILTDLMMPVMDGISFCSKIKRDSGTAHICVIILSAKVDDRTQIEGFKAGADDFIFKPFSIEVLARKIYNTLRTRQRVLEKHSNDGVSFDSMGLNVAENELLKLAAAVVERNMDNSSFSVDDFAMEMNMSKSNLHSKLRMVTGDAPLDFIRRIRFKQACELMRQGKYSISEISYKVGFSTPSYFTASFKRHFGVLPTEYMKRQSGTQE